MRKSIEWSLTIECFSSVNDVFDIAHLQLSHCSSIPPPPPSFPSHTIILVTSCSSFCTAPNAYLQLVHFIFFFIQSFLISLLRLNNSLTYSCLHTFSSPVECTDLQFIRIRTSSNQNSPTEFEEVIGSNNRIDSIRVLIHKLLNNLHSNILSISHPTWAISSRKANANLRGKAFSHRHRAQIAPFVT